MKVGHFEVPDSEVAEMKEVFDLLDEDGGGSISTAEVKKLTDLLNLQMTMEEVEHMVQEIDSDGSGEIDFMEFLAVMIGPQELPYNRKDILRAFRMFQDPGAPAGCISPEALEKALLEYSGDKISPDEAVRLSSALEVNSDGWINYQEKINVFMSSA